MKRAHARSFPFMQLRTSLPWSLGARSGRRSKRVVGPIMARIAPFHLRLYRGIAATPEARKIARDLYRPMRQREQLDRERHTAHRDRGMAIKAEQLLHANCDLWSSLGAIVDCNQ